MEMMGSDIEAGSPAVLWGVRMGLRLVLDKGRTIGGVELDLTASSLWQWVKQAHGDRTKGKTGMTTEACVSSTSGVVLVG